MLENYNTKYQDSGGWLIFLPTEASRKFGDKLIERTLDHWCPPIFCYHLLPGGHVAAARAHLPNRMFVRIDILKFYDTITRSKIHLSLRDVGFKQRHAFDTATCSTVSKAPSGCGPPYSLPFGFVQSPMLATLALMSSALGGAITNIHSAGLVTISVYMDDIILSADCLADLDAAKATLEAAAMMAGFMFHPTKGSGPALSVTVFNINIRHKDMELTPKRYAEFETAILSDPIGHTTGGILSYVSTVNPAQYSRLALLKP